MIAIHLARNREEIGEALKIREEVFIKGQNVSPELDRDGLDESAEHAILYLDSKPVGTARLRYLGNRIKLERFAVLEEFRGFGLGAKLMNFLIGQGKKKGVDEIHMHAQHYLVNYYSKFGFRPRGEIFYEANIKHIEMFLDLGKKY